jgi:hypothetical protein
MRCIVPKVAADAKWKGDELHVTFTQTPRLSLNAAQRKKLESGGDLEVVVRFYAFPIPADTAVSIAMRVCRIRYDEVDQEYLVSRIGAGATVAELDTPKLQRALDSCLFGPPFVVTDTQMLGTKPATIAGVVDIDPPPLLLDGLRIMAKKLPGYFALKKPMARNSFRALFCAEPPPHQAFAFQLPGQYP